MITGSLNLRALVHVEMEAKGKNGQVKGLFIPFDANNLEQHKSGGVFLNLVAFEMREPKDYATHIVKQSLPKEMREKMSKEEKESMPILGNLQTARSEPSSENNDAGAGKTFSPEDDLPF